MSHPTLARRPRATAPCLINPCPKLLRRPTRPRDAPAILPRGPATPPRRSRDVPTTLPRRSHDAAMTPRAAPATPCESLRCSRDTPRGATLPRRLARPPRHLARRRDISATPREAPWGSREAPATPPATPLRRPRRPHYAPATPPPPRRPRDVGSISKIMLVPPGKSLTSEITARKRTRKPCGGKMCKALGGALSGRMLARGSLDEFRAILQTAHEPLDPALDG